MNGDIKAIEQLTDMKVAPSGDDRCSLNNQPHRPRVYVVFLARRMQG